MRKTLEQRLWEKVDRTGDCWVWTAKTRSSFGYGMIRVGGTPGRLVSAHRVAWELTNGPIPDGLWVLHGCDNPPCCNPAHLHLGTRADNMREMSERGRAKGNKAGPRKACRNGHPKPPGRCPACAKAQQSRWLAKNPTYHRDWKRAKRTEK